MASSESDGPKLVWTFPLFRMVADRENTIFNAIASSGGGIGSNVDKVRESAQETVNELSGNAVSSSEDDSSYSGDGELFELSQEIDELEDGGNFSFSEEVAPGAGNTVAVNDGVFTPVVQQVDKGEKVTWINQTPTERVIRIETAESSVSTRLGPEETFSTDFSEDTNVEFYDESEGQTEMCGAVVVGDVTEAPNVPCRDNIVLETFGVDISESSGTESAPAQAARRSNSSMSEAAEEKQDMDIGFS